jgi:hypothetical protein
MIILRTTVAPIVTTVAFAFLGFTPTASGSTTAPPDPSKNSSAVVDSAAAQPVVILYYFHRTLRCQTCLTIEAYIDEALRTHYADALEDGRLRWLPTNIEEPQNAHFEEDFSLDFNSAILVHLDGQRSISWLNLEKVWDLVEHKDEFMAYIRDQIELVLSPEAH